MTVRVLQLNSEGDPTGAEHKDFATVEQAQKWCEEQRGAKLEWGEEGRFFSLEGMTEAEVEAMGEEGEYPPVRYWIHGIENDGEMRELEDEDFENADDVELSRN
jgi:hypothetical protein